MALAMLMMAASVLCPAGVMAWDDPICETLTDPEQLAAANCENEETVVSKVPGAVLAVFSVIGIVAVGVIIFGGVRYAISQGDPGKVKKAKDTIMYALIGLLVVLLAFAIVNFVLGGIS